MIELKNLDFQKIFKTGGKVLAGVLALVVLFVLFGGPVEESKGTRYEELMNRGILRIGVSGDMPKLGVETDGEVQGLEADLAKRITQDIFGKSSVPMLIPYSARTREYALQNGDVDLLICRMSNADASEGTYIYSDPYFIDAVSFMAKNGENMTLEDLSGKKVACIYKSAAQTDFVNEVKKRGLTLQVLEYASYPEAMEALQKGSVDAFAEYTLVLNKYLKTGYSMSADRFAPQELCVAALPEDKELMQQVQKTLQAMEQSGQLGALRKKWGLLG
ncbi:MAG: substrate-binding periplasmic protein [Bacillota bacterium]